MSLNSALNAAQLSLSANSKRVSISARNVAGANDENYSRKVAPLVTLHGGVYAAGPVRAGDVRLYERYLGATSDAARGQAVLSGLTHLSKTVGDTAAGTSLVARLGVLTDSLRDYANASADDNLARQVIISAKDMARSLNNAGQIVEEVRSGAAADITASVERINNLLSEFQQANRSVIQGTAAKADITDVLDRRDALVASLSEEIGISIVLRPDNDMVLYTDGGVTLFEVSARHVRADVTAGEPVRVFIDGVQVAGDAPYMPSNAGRLVGLTALHNDVSVEYAQKLDTLAFGLINAFREIDPDAVGSDLAGLFVDGSNPGSVAFVDDLARTIAVNASVDPAAGGDLRKLRDGIGYNYNPDGAVTPAPSFSGHLLDLLGRLDTKTPELEDKTPLTYAASSMSWLENNRQASDNISKSNEAVLQLVKTSLSNARGVNVNEETALQLELERLFGASARLISVIDNLFNILLSVVR